MADRTETTMIDLKNISDEQKIAQYNEAMEMIASKPERLHLLINGLKDLDIDTEVNLVNIMKAFALCIAINSEKCSEFDALKSFLEVSDKFPRNELKKALNEIGKEPTLLNMIVTYIVMSEFSDIEEQSNCTQIQIDIGRNEKTNKVDMIIVEAKEYVCMYQFGEHGWTSTIAKGSNLYEKTNNTYGELEPVYDMLIEKFKDKPKNAGFIAILKQLHFTLDILNETDADSVGRIINDIMGTHGSIESNEKVVIEGSIREILRNGMAYGTNSSGKN